MHEIRKQYLHEKIIGGIIVAKTDEKKKIRVATGTYMEACENIAKKTVKDLQAAGIKEAKTVQENNVIRVICGEFEAEDQANEAIEEIKKAGFTAFVLAQ